jgi:hypothetical protein
MQVDKRIVFKLEMNPGNKATEEKLLPDFEKATQAWKKDRLCKDIENKIASLIANGFDRQQPVDGLRIDFVDIASVGSICSFTVSYRFNREYTDAVGQKLYEATDLIAREFVKNFTMYFDYRAIDFNHYKGMVRAVSYSIS